MFHGSGWALEKINHLEVKMANFTPVKGSSYIAPPGELQGLRSLLNIWSHRDNKCFLYCFTAAYHSHHGPELETDTWRTVTSPTLYSSNNPSAHQANGLYDMPMGFKDLPRFENLNSVQVNIFRYEKSSSALSGYPSEQTMVSQWTCYCYKRTTSTILF